MSSSTLVPDGKAGVMMGMRCMRSCWLAWQQSDADNLLSLFGWPSDSKS